MFSIGYHQCDELFQVYEFAGYKLGLNSASILPWEFHEQMRSGIQPFIVYAITKAFHALSFTNPFTIACFIRLCMALLSFVSMVKLLNLLDEEIQSNKLKSWLWWAGLLFWCFPYFHARFSAENFSSTLFTFGLVVLLKAIRTNNNLLSYFFSGSLFGIAFHCRFQMSFMIAGLMAWLLFVNKTSLKLLVVLFVGIVLALGLGALSDNWLYGHWTLSWWNYLDLNLFQNKASQFGEQPIYFYLEQYFLQLIPPFSLAIVFCILAFWIKFKTHLLTWTTLPFILLHFFVAHKELRFLFPVLNFLPFMIILYFQSLKESSHRFVLFFKRNAWLRFAVVVNIGALCAFTFMPADNISYSFKKIYDLVEGEDPVLYYSGTNPYNNAAALNYFRNSAIQTVSLDSDTLNIKGREVYYLSDKFNEGKTLMKNNKIFERIYSNFPDWFSYLNFNGWLDRSVCFSIYKQSNPGN